jgi:uncharacterized alpha-E superfamily protein
MNSIHRGSLVTAAIPTTAYPAALVSSTTTSLIDLSVGDTLAASSIISSVDAASNANAMVVDLSVEETQLRSSIGRRTAKRTKSQTIRIQIFQPLAKSMRRQCISI